MAFAVAVTLVAAAILLDSTASLVISVIAFLFGGSDLIGLKSTKRIIDSLRISIADEGLTFIVGPDQIRVLYPWRSLSVTDIRHNETTVESFVVRDTKRKRSQVCVQGFENMDALLIAVQERMRNT